MLSNNLTTDCDNICNLCYAEKKEKCVICNYNFTYNIQTNIKSCHDLKTQYIENIQSTIQDIKELNILETTIFIAEKRSDNIETKDINTEQIVTTEIIEEEKNISFSCAIDEIISGHCHSKISNEQIKLIYENLKSHITANTNEIIFTDNVIFHIYPLCMSKKKMNILIYLQLI